VRTKAGRYVLEDCVLDGPGWSYWRGTDEVLRRAVGLLAVNASYPLVDELPGAARRSAAVDDPRIQRVLDVLSDDEGTCLVIEWMAASSLEDIVGEGPLADVESWRITLEVARALAAAAEGGLHHGALAPHWVLRGDGGRVRLVGLCVAEVLTGGGAPTTALDDAHGLGALLYTGLTGRWPGDPAWSSLPAAPTQGGRPVRPRMVRAGVPAALDDVAARVFGLPGRSAPLTTRAEVAAALERVSEKMARFDATEPVALDAAVLAELADTGYGARVAAETEPPADRRAVGPRLLAAVVAALLVALVGLGAWVVSRALDDRPAVASTTGPSGSASATAPPTGARVPIASVRDFDPDGNGTENPDQVRYAYDGNPSTAWHTVTYYNRPDLGGLKPGVGLIVDLGVSTQVGAVRVRLVGHGTSLELRAAAQEGARADDYVTVAHADNVGALVTLRPDEQPMHVRYLLLWLTELPLAPNGVDYQGGVAEIEVFRS